MVFRIKNLKRAVNLAVVILMAAAIITGCASTPEEKTAQITAPTPSDEAVMKDADTGTKSAATTPAVTAQALGAVENEPISQDLQQAYVSGKLTLEECVSLALKKSPALRSAVDSVEGAEWQRKQAFTGFLPTFSLDYTYTQLDHTPMQPGMVINTGNPLMPVISTPAVQAGDKEFYQMQISVTQPVFTGFSTLSKYEMAKLGLDVAKILKDQTRMDIVLQAKQSYLQILLAQKGVEVAEQSVKQIGEHLNVARSFYEVGMVPKNEMLQAEVQQAEAIQKQTVAEHTLRYAKSALNVLIRRDITAPLYLSEDIQCLQPIEVDLNESIDRALKARPEIMAAKKQILISEQEVRQAKSGYYPEVAVIYNNIKKGPEWDVDGGRYQEGNAWNIAAVASWNFWEWGRTRDGVQYANTEVSKAKNSLIQVKDAVQLEVKQNYLALQATRKNIGVAQKAVEQAEENYRMSEERYREQVATSTEVTDAETLLTSARTNYFNALYDHCLARARLERAMGATHP